MQDGINILIGADVVPTKINQEDNILYKPVPMHSNYFYLGET